MGRNILFIYLIAFFKKYNPRSEEYEVDYNIQYTVVMKQK